MQTTKFSVLICAFMACAPLTLRATDTPAQAAARAQVGEKLNELEAQNADTNPPVPSRAIVAPVVATPTPAPTMSSPVISTPAVKPVDQAELKREAKAKAKADKAAAKLKAKQDAERAKAQAAVQAQMEKAQPMPTPSADVGNEIGLKALVAPALPINASKEARLQALLAKYQADQISPEEYHKQRADILSQP
jgi:hypothetical protein